jgi:hypothetical protein
MIKSNKFFRAEIAELKSAVLAFFDVTINIFNIFIKIINFIKKYFTNINFCFIILNIERGGVK